MSGAPAARTPTRLERWIARERPLAFAGLALAVVLAWSWLVPAALDMYGAMNGPAAWMMRSDWTLGYSLAIFAMWAAMMLGMMLPSAAPVLLLYARVIRSSGESASLRLYLFALGYLLTWTAFSLAATGLQWALSRGALLSPMMETRTPLLGGALLVLAGVWQFTAMKRACLVFCRSPAAFFAQSWRRGRLGALRMGIKHGVYCLGCCWALMLLLFVGGVMNLVWIVAITGFVLLEKIAPLGAQGGRLSGVLLLMAGVAELMAAWLQSS